MNSGIRVANVCQENNAQKRLFSLEMYLHHAFLTSEPLRSLSLFLLFPCILHKMEDKTSIIPGKKSNQVKKAN